MSRYNEDALITSPLRTDSGNISQRASLIVKRYEKREIRRESRACKHTTCSTYLLIRVIIAKPFDDYIRRVPFACFNRDRSRTRGISN